MKIAFPISTFGNFTSIVFLSWEIIFAIKHKYGRFGNSWVVSIKLKSIHGCFAAISDLLLVSWDLPDLCASFGGHSRFYLAPYGSGCVSLGALLMAGLKCGNSCAHSSFLGLFCLLAFFWYKWNIVFPWTGNQRGRLCLAHPVTCVLARGVSNCWILGTFVFRFFASFFLKKIFAGVCASGWLCCQEE